MGVGNHGDDRSAESLFARAQSQHGIGLIFAVDDESLRTGEGSQVETVISQGRVHDPLFALVKPPRHRLVLFDQQGGQVPAPELLHECLDFRSVAVNDYVTVECGER